MGEIMAVVRESQAQNVNQNAGGSGPLTPKAIKITDLFGRCSSQGSWAGTALDYLNEIRKLMEDPSRPNKAEMKYLSDDAVAFSIGNNSVVLVRDTDASNLQALINDVRIYTARDTFYEILKGNNLLNVITVNRFMFSRPTQMAAYITQTLSAAIDEQIQDLVIDNFDNYQINVDTEMSNVRAFFDEHSPNPVVAGDFGFIAGVSEKTNRTYGVQMSKPMFGVTGYVEFIQNEQNNTFTPIVHVTDILSVMSSAKILAIAIPLIADIFITRGLWRHPFTSFGKTDINIGNLLVDHKTQQLYSVTNDFDMKKMITEYINAPILSIDIKSGAPSIPGLTMLTRTADHGYLASQIYSFLNVGLENVPTGAIGENVFKEIIGVFETGRNKLGSNLSDTRDMTYLNLVTKLKWSPGLEPLKTRLEADPTKRWAYICELAGDAGMIPTHSSITTALYNDFVQSVSSIVADKVSVSIPSLTTVPSINFDGLASRSFTPGSSMFGASGINMMSQGFPRF